MTIHFPLHKGYTIAPSASKKTLSSVCSRCRSPAKASAVTFGDGVPVGDGGGGGSNICWDSAVQADRVPGIGLGALM